jgi:hypothetical protein
VGSARQGRRPSRRGRVGAGVRGPARRHESGRPNVAHSGPLGRPSRSPGKPRSDASRRKCSPGRFVMHLLCDIAFLLCAFYSTRAYCSQSGPSEPKLACAGWRGRPATKSLGRSQWAVLVRPHPPWASLVIESPAFPPGGAFVFAIDTLSDRPYNPRSHAHEIGSEHVTASPAAQPAVPEPARPPVWIGLLAHARTRLEQRQSSPGRCERAGFLLRGKG